MASIQPLSIKLSGVKETGRGAVSDKQGRAKSRNGGESPNNLNFSNPFSFNRTTSVLEYRQKSLREKMAYEKAVNDMDIWERTKYRQEKKHFDNTSFSPTRVDEILEEQDPQDKDFLKANPALIRDTVPKIRESIKYTVDKQREAFFVNVDIASKRGQVSKLREQYGKREADIERAERELNIYLKSFEVFLQENDNETVKLIDEAEEATRKRLKYETELEIAKQKLNEAKLEINAKETEISTVIRFARFLSGFNVSFAARKERDEKRRLNIARMRKIACEYELSHKMEEYGEVFSWGAGNGNRNFNSSISGGGIGLPTQRPLSNNRLSQKMAKDPTALNFIGSIPKSSHDCIRYILEGAKNGRKIFDANEYKDIVVGKKSNENKDKEGRDSVVGDNEKIGKGTHDYDSTFDLSQSLAHPAQPKANTYKLETIKEGKSMQGPSHTKQHSIKQTVGYVATSPTASGGNSYNLPNISKSADTSLQRSNKAKVKGRNINKDGNDDKHNWDNIRPRGGEDFGRAQYVSGSGSTVSTGNNTEGTKGADGQSEDEDTNGSDRSNTSEAKLVMATLPDEYYDNLPTSPPSGVAPEVILELLRAFQVPSMVEEMGDLMRKAGTRAPSNISKSTGTLSDEANHIEMLMEQFRRMEESNLFLIQNAQEQENIIDALKNEKKSLAGTKDSEINHLTEQLEQLETVYKTMSEGPSPVKFYKSISSQLDLQRAHLERVRAKVGEVFVKLKLGTEENAKAYDASSMLHIIENFMTTALDKLEAFPPQNILRIEKLREKERRKDARIAKDNEVKRINEERLMRSIQKTMEMDTKAKARPVHKRVFARERLKPVVEKTEDDTNNKTVSVENFYL